MLSRPTAACIALLVLLGMGAAQETSPPPTSTDPGKDVRNPEVLRVDNGVSAPRVLHQPEPKYSKEARKEKFQGTCVLWVVVGTDGKPHDIRVKRTLGHGLDEEAIKAVKKWTFEPARKDGQPVAAQVNVVVTFRLY